MVSSKKLLYTIWILFLLRKFYKRTNSLSGAGGEMSLHHQCPAPAQVFTVLTLGAAWTWWQKNAFISSKSFWRFGSQVNCPAVCFNYPASPAQPVQGTEGCKQLQHWKRKGLQSCPLHSSALQGYICASGHGSELIIPHAHTDEGSSTHRELRLPGAGWAQLSSQARLESSTCWHHWCVRTLVAETQLEHELQAALPKPGSSSLEEALPNPWRNNKWQCRKACLLSIHACKLSWAKQWMC